MWRTFLKLQGMQEVPNPASIQTMRLTLVEAKYSKDDDRVAFYERLKTALESVPGVESVAFIEPPSWRLDGIAIRDRRAAKTREWKLSVGFLARGESGLFSRYRNAADPRRAFDERDGLPGGQVAIVNQRFAVKHWPGQDALGKRVRLIREGSAEQPVKS